MARTGTTAAQMANVVVKCRSHVMANPKAPEETLLSTPVGLLGRSCRQNRLRSSPPLQ